MEDSTTEPDMNHVVKSLNTVISNSANKSKEKAINMFQSSDPPTHKLFNLFFMMTVTVITFLYLYVFTMVTFRNILIPLPQTSLKPIVVFLRFCFFLFCLSVGCYLGFISYKIYRYINTFISNQKVLKNMSKKLEDETNVNVFKISFPGTSPSVRENIKNFISSYKVENSSIEDYNSNYEYLYISKSFEKLLLANRIQNKSSGIAIKMENLFLIYPDIPLAIIKDDTLMSLRGTPLLENDATVNDS